MRPKALGRVQMYSWGQQGGCTSALPRSTSALYCSSGETVLSQLPGLKLLSAQGGPLWVPSFPELMTWLDWLFRRPIGSCDGPCTAGRLLC